MSINADKQFIESMPDLVMSVSRDGTIMSYGGGRAVPRLVPRAGSAGESLGAVWPGAAAQVVRQLIRKAIAARGTLEMTFMDEGQGYRACVTPEGPDRAVCVVRRELLQEIVDATPSPTGSFPRPYLDRRGFIRQFQETVAKSILTERPAALIAIHLEGVEEIAKIDTKIGEQVVTAALMRISSDSPRASLGMCLCIGQLSESQLAFLVSTEDRSHIEHFSREILSALAAPFLIELESFQLSCYSGVAVLRRDANSSKELLDCVRIALGEARRSAANRPRFFSDTMKLASRSRLDIAKELRDAISTQAVQTRCVGRHDLETGRLIALVAYARWVHPLRGEISPAEFLGVADATGEALVLSKAILKSIGLDFERLAATLESGVRFSYGPLRRHLAHADFVKDVATFLAAGPVTAAQFEVRIAEGTFVSLPESVCDRLEALGVQIVIDEVGRGMGSINRLARSPLWGMQLDRGWVESIRTEDLARRVCQAGIAAATALGIEPIATGVDCEAQRLALLEVGCRFGSGDLYPNAWSASLPAGNPMKHRSRRVSDGM